MRVLIADVRAAVAEKFKLQVDDLISRNQTKKYARARQIGMYVSRDLTDGSFPAIAAVFGRKDHTTVLHGVERISDFIERGHPRITLLTCAIREAAIQRAGARAMQYLPPPPYPMLALLPPNHFAKGDHDENRS